MSVLVFVDTRGASISKAAQETVTYGSKIAGAPVTVVTFGDASADALKALGANGAGKVIAARSVAAVDGQQLTKLISAVADAEGVNTVVCTHDDTGMTVAGRVAARMGAGHVPGATALPEGNTIPRNVFSGKAKAWVEVTSEKRVISLLPNSIAIEAAGGEAAVEDYSGDVGTARVAVKEVRSAGSGIALPEAEIVVSGGRGLKGPENWGMMEELAEVLGAGTACSRPVADMDWRPHHEHVGQTGVAIRPNCYIAVGISGAIQHLAGVNGSKVIAVINTDPEAPFFKAADYGIVGDAFEVVPKLVEAAKQLKAQG